MDHCPYGREDGQGRYRQKFYARAQYYRNVFDVKTGFIRARKSNGEFRVPFDPAVSILVAITPKAVLGNIHGICHMTMPGLISMLGGDAAAIAKIDQTFDAKVDEKIYAHMEDISA